jgi:hypothetical protein
LTIDDLPAAELVTADGQLLRVDDQTHPDLYWALRGGGGNFGVATRFRFRLHPVDQMSAACCYRRPPTPSPPSSPRPRRRRRRCRPSPTSCPPRRCRSCPPPTTAAWSSWPPSPTPATPRRASARRSGRSPRRSPTWSAPCPTRRSTARGGGVPPDRGVAHVFRRRHRPLRDRSDRRAP